MNVKSIVKNMTLNENIADVSWLVQIVVHDDVIASHVVFCLIYPVCDCLQAFQHDYHTLIGEPYPKRYAKM